MSLLTIACVQEDDKLREAFEQYQFDQDPVESILDSDMIPESKNTRRSILNRLKKLGLYSKQKYAKLDE
jgi:hypothetical protein